MRRSFFNLAAAVSLVILLLTLLCGRWGRLVVSGRGPASLNEQWAVQRIAFTASTPTPPPADFGRYDTRRVMPGVYRVDWIDEHASYLILPTWPIYGCASIAPTVWCVGLIRRVWRKDEAHRRRREGRCPTCGYDCRGPADGTLLARCPECGTDRPPGGGGDGGAVGEQAAG